MPDTEGFTALLTLSGSLYKGQEDELLLSSCHKHIVLPL